VRKSKFSGFRPLSDRLETPTNCGQFDALVITEGRGRGLWPQHMPICAFFCCSFSSPSHVPSLPASFSMGIEPVVTDFGDLLIQPLFGASQHVRVGFATGYY
jgi:hypothetical protein